MLNQNLKPNSIRRHSSAVTFKGKIPLVLPKNFIRLVNFFCQNINKVEWSGVLFYEVKGSIRKPEKMKLICHDIFLMDKGSATYTEFFTDPSIVGHMMKNKHLLNMKQGLIHSHQNMNTFFSGDDWNELDSTAPEHNMYLSLIVNNYNSFTAKVAFTGKAKAIIPNVYECLDQNGDPYKITTGEPTEVERTVLFDYDCDIISEIVKVEMNQSYIDRLKLIEEKAAAKIPQRPAYTPPITNTPSVYSQPKVYDNLQNDWGDHIASMQNKFEEEVEFDELAIAEAFNAYVMRFGTHNPDDTLDEAIIDLDSSKDIDVQTIVNGLVRELPVHFCKFYEIDPKEMTPKSYLSSVEFLQLQLQEYDQASYTPTPIVMEMDKCLTNHIESIKKQNNLL